MSDVLQPFLRLNIRPCRKVFQVQGDVVGQMMGVNLKTIAVVDIHQIDHRLPAMERVVVVTSGDGAVAYPLEKLSKEAVINHEVDGEPVVLFHKLGTASAVDASRINRGRDIGAVAVYSRRVGEQTLTFQKEDDDRYRDEETKTLWNFFGEAIEGPLKRSTLEPVVHYMPFWFAWAAFSPETPVYQ